MGEAVGPDLHSVPASLNVDSQWAEVKNCDLGLILRNLARLDDDEVAEHHLNGVPVAEKIDCEILVLGFVPLDDRLPVLSLSRRGKPNHRGLRSLPYEDRKVTFRLNGDSASDQDVRAERQRAVGRVTSGQGRCFSRIVQRISLAVSRFSSSG